MQINESIFTKLKRNDSINEKKHLTITNVLIVGMPLSSCFLVRNLTNPWFGNVLIVNVQLLILGLV